MKIQESPTYYSWIPSPFGQILILSDGKNLEGLYLQAHTEKILIKHLWIESGRAAPFEETQRQLEEYFAGKRLVFDLPFNPQGTVFQQEVWKALLDIPYGEVRSYQQLADRINRSHSARAVGQANGSNPISIIIPCHRVIGKNGNLTGYGGGIEVKAALLNLERETITNR